MCVIFIMRPDVCETPLRQTRAQKKTCCSKRVKYFYEAARTHCPKRPKGRARVLGLLGLLGLLGPKAQAWAWSMGPKGSATAAHADLEWQRKGATQHATLEEAEQTHNTTPMSCFTQNLRRGGALIATLLMLSLPPCPLLTKHLRNTCARKPRQYDQQDAAWHCICQRELTQTHANAHGHHLQPGAHSKRSSSRFAALSVAMGRVLNNVLCCFDV